MNQRIRIALVAVLLLGFLGYRQFARHERGAPAPPAHAGSASADAAPKPTRRLGSLAFTPCTLAPDFGTQSVEAQCGQLAVLENRAAPTGRKIKLAIAWLPAKGEALPDPVVMIAGGPGQSALESFPSIAPAFAELRKKRDIILVDQRGTGGSNKLVCKNAKGKNALVEEGTDSLVEARAFAERCARELSAKADLRYYATTDAIQDLEDVRRAIGAPQLNLMGVSYGTRVAQQYGKRYPAQTRTITIDGIAPNSLVLGNDFAKNLESSLDRQFGRCASNAGCRDKLGDPRARLNALMTLLKASPPLVKYRDAITGEAKEEKLTPDHIATLARMFAYAPQVAGLLPLELNEAAQGRYEPLMALSKLLVGTIGDQITAGMQLSVICTEDADELKIDPADGGSLLGTDLVSVLQTQCAVWPRGQRPADFRQPLTGPVPVLILSGEFDPVTPPRYGDEVLKSLPNGRHLVLRGQGHNVLPVGCMPKLFARFVDAANAKDLDVGCLDKVPYAQPFTGFYGWEP
jgi:pimeloyl-ACP methyl ester carboxylesterase